jgi:hypothetical protein
LSLADGRLRCAEIRASVAGGRDPRSGNAKAPGPAAPAKPTFEMMAREWHKTNTRRWKPSHAAHVMETLIHQQGLRHGQSAGSLAYHVPALIPA